MSILIQGMGMPDRRTAELMHTELACVSRECDRHCENCDLVQDREELIAAFHEAIRVLGTVANAAQLPAGHGRLIDADALMNNIGDVPYKGSVRRVLLSAPTIVPAEGGGEDENR